MYAMSQYYVRMYNIYIVNTLDLVNNNLRNDVYDSI